MFTRIILAFSCLLFAIRATGQNQTFRSDISGVRGNVIQSSKLYLFPADTLKPISVRATFSSAANSDLINPQPTFKRTGLEVIITYSPTIDLQPTTWYKLLVGGSTRYYGRVDVRETAPPGNPSPPTPEPIVLPGSTSKVFTLINAPPGYTIEHNKANRLVKGTFYRDDTGQIETLWRIRIENDNRISVFGPPFETFSGRLVLDFTNQLNN